MKIKDLPQPIKELALKRQVEQGNPANEELDLGEVTEFGGFYWKNTIEKFDFWREINYKNFKPFYELEEQKELNSKLSNYLKSIIRKDFDSCHETEASEKIELAEILFSRLEIDASDFINEMKSDIKK